MPRVHLRIPVLCRPRRRAQRRRLNTMLYLLILLLTILAPFYMVYKPPKFFVNYLAYRWPDVLWHVNLPSGSSFTKTVALTIDDAPSEYTADILALLRAHGATATLFVIGSQVPGREEVLREAVRMGCELGNHAMRDEASRDLTLLELQAQVRTVDNLIADVYATAFRDNSAASSTSSSVSDTTPTHSHPLPQPPDLFRPGSGFFSTQMRAFVHSIGHTLVLGSIYPHDPQIPYWRVNAAHVLSMLRPGGIIICHDRRSWTLPMLKRVLSVGGERGWRFVSVSELVGLAEAEGGKG